MNEFERAFRLMDALNERSAERLEPTPYGPVLVHERLTRVHDLNFLRAEEPGEASAEQLAAETDRVQGAVPELEHRRVNLRSEEVARRLEPDFVGLGWEPQWFVLMAYGRPPDRTPDAPVREVDEPALRPLWATGIRNAPFGKDERVVEQLIEHRRLVAQAIPTRFFAAEVDGELVAHAELYSYDGVGQIENVVTLPEFRRRGLARAIVQRAVQESAATGNDLAFLVADAFDWPQKLYEKLGFETVGRYARFLKRLPTGA